MQQIAYIPMTADLFHAGHLDVICETYLQYKVIIGLLTDKAIRDYKGKSPITPFEERFRILKANTYVYLVVPQETIDPYDNLIKYEVDVVVSGDGFEKEELDAISKAGVEPLTVGIKNHSTTNLIKKICQRYC